MNTLVHLLAGTAVAVPLHALGVLSLQAVFVFVALGVLIDVDHLLYYTVRYRTLDLRRIARIQLGDRERMRANCYVLHSPEFNAALAAFSVLHPTGLIAVASNALHLSLDAVEHYRHHRGFGWYRRWSVLATLRG